jgi:hypothetical protein
MPDMADALLNPSPLACGKEPSAVGALKKSLHVQIMKFFTVLPGESMARFGAELNALTADDKRVLAAMLTAAGYPCDGPQAPAAAPAQRHHPQGADLQGDQGVTIAYASPVVAGGPELPPYQAVVHLH